MTAYSSDVPIYQALANVKSEISAVGKNEFNSQQGFQFRGVDAVVTEISPALKRHGVTPIPEVLSIDVEHTTVGKYGTPAKSVSLLVKYRFVGPAGDELAATVPAEAMDTGDKATAKAMSVAFRTCLLQVFSLPTDEADPDTQTYERSSAQQQPENQENGKPAKQEAIEPAKQEATDHANWENDLAALDGSYDGLRQLWLAAEQAGCTQEYLDRVAAAGARAKNGGGR